MTNSSVRGRAALRAGSASSPAMTPAEIAALRHAVECEPQAAAGSAGLLPGRVMRRLAAPGLPGHRLDPPHRRGLACAVGLGG
jgi:hypothetical protein